MSFPRAIHKNAAASTTPDHTNIVCRQPPSQPSMNGINTVPVPISMSTMEMEKPFASPKRRLEIHWIIRMFRGDWHACKTMPSPIRANSRAPNPGAAPAKAISPDAAKNPTAAVLQGLNLDTHQFIGIEKTTFASSNDDPSHPCSAGDRSRSSTMSGRNNPSDVVATSTEASPTVK